MKWFAFSLILISGCAATPPKKDTFDYDTLIKEHHKSIDENYRQKMKELHDRYEKNMARIDYLEELNRQKIEKDAINGRFDD